jgi:hypothetical protein
MYFVTVQVSFLEKLESQESNGKNVIIFFQYDMPNLNLKSTTSISGSASYRMEVILALYFPL